MAKSTTLYIEVAPQLDFPRRYEREVWRTAFNDFSLQGGAIGQLALVGTGAVKLENNDCWNGKYLPYSSSAHRHQVKVER